MPHTRPTRKSEFVQSDGGRREYAETSGEHLGYGDCITRAIVHAAGISYQTAREMLMQEFRAQGLHLRRRRKKDVSKGTPYSVSLKVLAKLGFEQLDDSDMRTIARAVKASGDAYGNVGNWATVVKHALLLVHRHAVAIVDGKVQDTFDSRGLQVEQCWVRNPDTFMDVIRKLDTTAVVSVNRHQWWRFDSKYQYLQVRVNKKYCVGSIKQDNGYYVFESSDFYREEFENFDEFPMAGKRYSELRTLKREVKTHYQSFRLA